MASATPKKRERKRGAVAPPLRPRAGGHPGPLAAHGRRRAAGGAQIRGGAGHPKVKKKRERKEKKRKKRKNKKRKKKRKEKGRRKGKEKERKKKKKRGEEGEFAGVEGSPAWRSESR